MVEVIQVFVGLAILCYIVYLFGCVLLMLVEDLLSDDKKSLLQSLRKILNDETCLNSTIYRRGNLYFTDDLDEIYLTISPDRVGYQHNSLFHFTDMPFWVGVLIKKDLKRAIRYVTKKESVLKDIVENIEKNLKD